MVRLSKLIFLSALLGCNVVYADSTAWNARAVGLTETIPYTLNDQLCRTQKGGTVLFCITEANTFDSESYRELKSFIKGYPESMLKDWGLYSREATEKTYGKNSKKVVPDALGVSMMSNVFGFVFEDGLKEPEIHISHGVGPRAIDGLPGVYIRVPLPFSKKQLADWAQKNSLRWSATLFATDLLKKNFALLSPKACPEYYKPSVLRVQQVNVRQFAPIPPKDEDLSVLVQKENCRELFESRMKGIKGPIDKKLLDIQLQRAELLGETFSLEAQYGHERDFEQETVELEGPAAERAQREIKKLNEEIEKLLKKQSALIDCPTCDRNGATTMARIREQIESHARKIEILEPQARKVINETVEKIKIRKKFKRLTDEDLKLWYESYPLKSELALLQQALDECNAKQQKK